MLEAGQLLCTAGKWLSQDSVVLLQDFCFPLIVKVPGRGHALPASQHLRAEEEQGPGAAGSLVSGLQAFSLKRPKLERGEDDSFFCDQRESQLQILLSFFTSPGARGLAGHIPTVCFLSSPLHVVGGQQCLNK